MCDPVTKRGILINFDLANDIQPGDRSPRRRGYHERAGTIPFLAIELLADAECNVRPHRRYRHELESFAWILLWVCCCVEDGISTIRPPFDEWVTPSNITVRLCKMDVAYQMPNTSRDYQRLLNAVNVWLKWWLLRYQTTIYANSRNSRGATDLMIDQIEDLLPRPQPIIEQEDSWYLGAIIRLTPKDLGPSIDTAKLLSKLDENR